MLITPRAIKVPRVDEIPGDIQDEMIARLEERKTANIVEGYRISYPAADKVVPYKFFAEINIDNPRLWDLFMALAGELPDMASCVYNVSREKAIFGKYIPKDELLGFLQQYRKEIVEDCFFELGVLYNDPHDLIEVFIHEAKYVRFWGVSEVSFRLVMEQFALEEVPDIAFIDEYPKVIVALSMLDKSVLRTEEIVRQLNEYFAEK